VDATAVRPRGREPAVAGSRPGRARRERGGESGGGAMGRERACIGRGRYRGMARDGAQVASGRPADPARPAARAGALPDRGAKPRPPGIYGAPVRLRGGIDLGGTKVDAIVVDDGHEIHGRSRRPTPTEGGPPGVVHELAAVMRAAASSAGIEVASLAGVGVGALGKVA